MYCSILHKDEANTGRNNNFIDKMAMHGKVRDRCRRCSKMNLESLYFGVVLCNSYLYQLSDLGIRFGLAKCQ